MKWVVSIYLLSFNFLSVNGQVIDTVYNLNLEAISITEIANKDFVLLNNNACVGCVKYVLESGVTENILVLTNQFSLMEVYSLIEAYDLDSKNVYFILKSEFGDFDRSPGVLKQNSIIISYPEIVKLSNDYNFSKEQFKVNVMEFSN